MGPFATTLVDPPWPEVGAGFYRRGADRHYKVLDKPGCKTCPEILATILAASNWAPADDAHLWLWATDNYLEAGLWLVGQLGFRFIRTFQWVKIGKDGNLKPGIGQYGRGCHEMMLFATRGRGFSVKTERNDIKSVFLAQHEYENGKIKHSKKPSASYDLVEARSKGPFAEIFARRGRPGWTSWGDEYKE